MNKRQPKKLTIEHVLKRIEGNGVIKGNVFFYKGFGVSVNMMNFFSQFIVDKTPFLLDDYRFGIVKKGRARVIINLKEVTVSAGTIVFVTPGTIAEPLWSSDDLELDGIGLPADFMSLALESNVPPLLNGQMKDGQLQISGKEAILTDTLYQTLWQIVSTSPASMPAAMSMTATIMRYFDHLFTVHNAIHPADSSSSSIFDRFIYLVNLHCKEQRQLSFYADKMCITERYLGSIVKSASSITAKEWIDRAVLTTAKVMLRHTDKQVVQIADELHFASSSFFCKYFHRLAGMTPQEYRKN